ncbi:MAG: pilin [Candidatus Pacebacteria bacterium]|nr:pilin [Candidatus Paceibacterota bacterium]
MKKFFKGLQFFLIAFLIISPVVAIYAQVPLTDPSSMGNQAEIFRQYAGFADSGGEATAVNIVATVIQIALGVLGIIFLILLILAGYTWMTAGGNEEQVGKAKKNIKNAIIGLVIVLAAYGITWFVFEYLPFQGVTGDATTTNPPPL